LIGSASFSKPGSGYPDVAQPPLPGKASAQIELILQSDGKEVYILQVFVRQ